MIAIRTATVAAGAILSAGSAMFGFGWFAQPVSVPRFILFAFLLLPVGDVQGIVAALSERAKGRISKNTQQD